MQKRYLDFDKNFNIKIVDQPKKTKKKSSVFSLVNVGNLGYYIITPIIAGVFLGLAVDRYFKTKNLFFLFFLALGMIGAFYNMYKIYKDGK